MKRRYLSDKLDVNPDSAIVGTQVVYKRKRYRVLQVAANILLGRKKQREEISYKEAKNTRVIE